MLRPRRAAGQVGRVVGDSPTYVSFDIDALDPAFAPGTGTPETGGLTPLFAQQLLRGLGEGGDNLAVDLLGADLVEVSPPFDCQPAELTSLAGDNMLFELLCVDSRDGGGPPADGTVVVRRRGGDRFVVISKYQYILDSHKLL